MLLKAIQYFPKYHLNLDIILTTFFPCYKIFDKLFKTCLPMQIFNYNSRPISKSYYKKLISFFHDLVSFYSKD